MLIEHHIINRKINTTKPLIGTTDSNTNNTYCIMKNEVQKFVKQKRVCSEI